MQGTPSPAVTAVAVPPSPAARAAFAGGAVSRAGSAHSLAMTKPKRGRPPAPKGGLWFPTILLLIDEFPDPELRALTGMTVCRKNRDGLMEFTFTGMHGVQGQFLRRLVQRVLGHLGGDPSQPTTWNALMRHLRDPKDVDVGGTLHPKVSLFKSTNRGGHATEHAENGESQPYVERTLADGGLPGTTAACADLLRAHLNEGSTVHSVWIAPCADLLTLAVQDAVTLSVGEATQIAKMLLTRENTPKIGSLKRLEMDVRLQVIVLKKNADGRMKRYDFGAAAAKYAEAAALFPMDHEQIVLPKLIDEAHAAVQKLDQVQTAVTTRGGEISWQDFVLMWLPAPVATVSPSVLPAAPAPVPVPLPVPPVPEPPPIGEAMQLDELPVWEFETQPGSSPFAEAIGAGGGTEAPLGEVLLPLNSGGSLDKLSGGSLGSWPADVDLWDSRALSGSEGSSLGGASMAPPPVGGADGSGDLEHTLSSSMQRQMSLTDTQEPQLSGSGCDDAGHMQEDEEEAPDCREVNMERPQVDSSPFVKTLEAGGAAMAPPAVGGEEGSDDLEHTLSNSMQPQMSLTDTQEWSVELEVSKDDWQQRCLWLDENEMKLCEPNLSDGTPGAVCGWSCLTKSVSGCRVTDLKNPRNITQGNAPFCLTLADGSKYKIVAAPPSGPLAEHWSLDSHDEMRRSLEVHQSAPLNKRSYRSATKACHQPPQRSPTGPSGRAGSPTRASQDGSWMSRQRSDRNDRSSGSVSFSGPITLPEEKEEAREVNVERREAMSRLVASLREERHRPGSTANARLAKLVGELLAAEADDMYDVLTGYGFGLGLGQYTAGQFEHQLTPMEMDSLADVLSDEFSALNKRQLSRGSRGEEGRKKDRTALISEAIPPPPARIYRTSSPLQDFLVEGAWLEKAGADGGLGSWAPSFLSDGFNKRYFKLDGHELHYYASKEASEKSKGMIDLRTASGVDTPVVPVDGKPQEFKLLTEGREWHFRCYEESGPVDKWKDALATIVKRASFRLPRASSSASPRGSLAGD